MREHKIIVTRDEIQKHDRPARSFSLGFPASEQWKATRPKRQGLLIVICILVGLAIVGGAGAGTWFWLAKSRAGNDAIAIEEVMNQCAGCRQGATSVAEVVRCMRAIDTSECPNDFRAAYLAHLHAWERMADVEEQAIVLKNHSESVGAIAESFIRGFLGDPFGKVLEIMEAQNQLEAEFKAADEQVKLTFHRVEEIAVAHGARLPATEN